MIEFISQPWHWTVSGAMIVVVMLLLLWFGGEQISPVWFYHNTSP